MHISYICICFLIPTSSAWLPGSSPVHPPPIRQRPCLPGARDSTYPPWTHGNPNPPSWQDPTNATWKMRGVNLGSKFIIEPWMTYDEFNSMGCGNQPDEWSCVEALGQAPADAVFATHRDNWITQEDILEIASFGLNTVRVPVSFWIKEDLVQANESFPRGALSYLDRLVSWCTDAGLVDTPGFFTQFNYERALQFLEWMTKRIHTNPAYKNVGMLEVMNEPAQSWQYPDQAQDMLKKYYPQALSRIRTVEHSLGVVPPRQLHVEYMSTAWGSGDPTTYLHDTRSTSFDDHRYLKWDPSITATKEGYLQAACNDYRGDVLVGEWSIAVADEVSSSPDLTIVDATSSQIEWYQKYWATQVVAYERSVGWVFLDVEVQLDWRIG